MRYLSSDIEQSLSKEHKMVLIAGPRQVGKTTLLKLLLSLKGAEAGYFNWDVESHRKAILREPERFWDRGLLAPKGKPRIGLDEIHKYPRWKRFLKGLYDSVGEKVEILVTGSGRLNVYQKGGDSLFGRYDLFHLHPFTVGEYLSPTKSVPAPREFWRFLFEKGSSADQDEALAHLERFTGFPE